MWPTCRASKQKNQDPNPLLPDSSAHVPTLYIYKVKSDQNLESIVLRGISFSSTHTRRLLFEIVLRVDFSVKW